MSEPSIEYRKGFNAAVDAVLNLLQTIDFSVSKVTYNTQVFREVEKLKAEDHYNG